MFRRLCTVPSLNRRLFRSTASVLSSGPQRIVLAIGGNALQSKDDTGTAEEIRANVDRAAADIAALIKDGHRLTIIHGNGPQVGSLILQQQMCAESIPPLPLSMCVASTQGHIGQLLQQSIGNQLREDNDDNDQEHPKVITVVTQIEVDSEDPAWNSPSKPIGKFYTEKEAYELREQTGAFVMEDSGRGWRVAVPSPRPGTIIEGPAISLLRDQGYTVIAGGGGGAALMKDSRTGRLISKDAVIDKDLVAEQMARQIGADLLVIATDVAQVCVDWANPQNRKAIGQASVSEMEAWLREGQFGAGSMGPKVEAAARFSQTMGQPAVICALNELGDAVRGRKGTMVVPDPASKEL